jgi:sugar lactone lactonase YvrE
MIQVKADHLLHVQNLLGEGPLWHPSERQYYWVDIERGDILTYSPSTLRMETHSIGTSVGALGFRDSGGLILACGLGFATWDSLAKKLHVIYDPIGDQPGVRLNDGRVDASGRFWAGGLDRKGQTGLFRLDPDLRCHTMLTNIKTSNGLAWSLDQKIFYYTDTGDYSIYKFDFDPVNGTIKNRKVFVQLPADRSKGVPDGLTIDSEGFIWSAHWDGGKITRYDPSGKPVLEVILPVSRVTSCTFGGDDLQDIFITTASTGLSKAQELNEPLAGDVFIFRTGIKGLPASYFTG